MIHTDFEELVQHILQLNPYLTQGYANAFKDATTDTIYAQTNKGLMPVFPNDNLGNYFYIRNEPVFNFVSNFAERVSDCGPSRVTYNDTITAQIVLLVVDADPLVLINNIRNTVASYKGFNATPTSAIWQRELVVSFEMAGFKPEEIQVVLARLKKQSIVRLTVQLSKDFVPSACISDPCNPC